MAEEKTKLRLVICCIEKNATNGIEGSRIKFYLKNGNHPKKFLKDWDIPLTSARRSLQLFNSPWKPKLMEKTKEIQEEYNIPDENVDSFAACTESAADKYAAMLERRKKRRLEKRKENLSEYRKMEYQVNKLNPEYKDAIKETRRQVKGSK